MFVIKPSVRIENIVATVTMNQSIDLGAISRNVPGVEYNPGRFPGLVYRLSKPRTATLIFSSGKMVCTGAKREDEVRVAVEKVYQRLKDLGVLYEE